jgi:hypothetical protein
LIGLSWIVWFAPGLKLKDTINAGVAVKNYITQTQEFSLYMVASAPFAFANSITMPWRQVARHWRSAFSPTWRRGVGAHARVRWEAVAEIEYRKR